MTTKIRVYLASPFFNDDQNNTVTKTEQLLDKYGFEYFSPRQHGGVYNKDASPEERAKQAQAIFDGNLDAMYHCDLAICNIDDRDTGTAWEYGWFNGKCIPAITFSGHNYGCNIMLAQSGLGHCPTLEILEKFLKELSDVWNDSSYDKTDINCVSNLVTIALNQIGINKRGHADE